VELASKAKEDEIQTPRTAEAAASKTTTTESTLKPETSSSSWWPNLSLWAGKGFDEKTEPSTGISSNPTKKEEEKDVGNK